MLFFGYIVSPIKYGDLQDDIVKVVNDQSECVKDIPKLIIGLNEAKEYAKSNNWKFDILNHTFPNGDMWTFKKTEKREFYEEDITEFKKVIVKHQESGIVYHYISIYSLPFKKVKRLYDIVFNNGLHKKTNYFIADRSMLYLSLDESNVIGLSFNHLKYIGIDRDKVIDKIKLNNSNRIYFTTSKKMWKLSDWFCGKEYVIASIFEKNAKNV